MTHTSIPLPVNMQQLSHEEIPVLGKQTIRFLSIVGLVCFTVGFGMSILSVYIRAAGVKATATSIVLYVGITILCLSLLLIILVEAFRDRKRSPNGRPTQRSFYRLPSRI